MKIKTLFKSIHQYKVRRFATDPKSLMLCQVNKNGSVDFLIEAEASKNKALTIAIPKIIHVISITTFNERWLRSTNTVLKRLRRKL